MPKLNLTDTKVLIISIVLLLAISGGIMYYFDNRIKISNEEFNIKLLLLNKQIVTNLNQLQQNLEESISSLKNNLSLEMELIDTSLKSFRDKNDRDLAAINSLIDEIERQSDIK
ncbi:MAG: hypothetical protein IH949_00825, partial [Bacteroidetes bacterium]|nr:hypothetical protein [Bacteroidota bacterium]